MSNPTPLSEPLLSEPQAAKILNVSIRTLQAWRCADKGPAFIRVGRAIRYRRSDLELYLQASTVQPSQPPRPHLS